MSEKSTLRAAGLLKAIAYRPVDGRQMMEVTQVTVEVGHGFNTENRPTGKREVTLLSAEAWEQTCHELESRLPWHSRRANLLIEGIDLPATIGWTVHIGAIALKIHGETRPCKLMDEQFSGLRNALLPDCRGGVFGQVVTGGTVCVGDSVSIVGE